MEKVITLVRTTTNSSQNNEQIENLNRYCKEKDYTIQRCYTNPVLGVMEEDDIKKIIEYAKQNHINKIVVWSIRFIGSSLEMIALTINLLNSNGISLVLALFDVEILYTDDCDDTASLLVVATIEELVAMEKLTNEDRKFKRRIWSMRRQYTRKGINE